MTSLSLLAGRTVSKILNKFENIMENGAYKQTSTTEAV